MIQMRILVTRAHDDAIRTAEALAARGHEPLVAPMFDVRYFNGPELAFEGVQAILVTSGNGIRALARRSRRRDIEVVAVGTHTAERARAEGFLRVTDARGDANALAALVRKHFSPGGGMLAHIAGSNASEILQRELTRSGFGMSNCVLYEISETPSLPDNAVDALRARTLDGVLLFSPRSARVFARCVLDAELGGNCGDVVAFCISNDTANTLTGLVFKEVLVALRPNQESVLSLLD